LSSQLVLEEQDSLHLARPGSVAPLNASRLLVTDQFYQRGIVYDSLGRALEVVGRDGRGPGEFKSIGAAVAIDDSTVVIFDDSQRLAQIFDTRTWRVRDRRPYLGTAYSPRAGGDHVWFGSSDAATGSLAKRIDLHGDSVRQIGQQPEGFRSLAALAGTHTLTSLALVQDAVLIGVSGLDSLYLHDARGGERQRAAWLPAIRRRQLPAEMDRLRREFDTPRPPDQIFALSSFLLGLQPLSSGDILVLHMDQDRVGQGIVSRPFVSLVSGDLRRACLDTPVPIQSESRIAAGFDGDNLLLLAQSSATGTIRTELFRFRISDAGCDWKALR